MQATTMKPRARKRAHELREYLVGDLHLLASPKDLMSLTLRRKRDPELDRLLRDFADPDKRDAMLIETKATLVVQCEYKYSHKGRLNFIIYGPAGLGKSEVAAVIMEWCGEVQHICTGKWALPGIGRNPSDINDLLAQAAKRGIPVIVIGDETEREVAQGSATEEGALISNIESNRVLQPTIIRCANRLERLKVFSFYCDFVFEIIFSDWDHRVNYCIMYLISEELGDELARVPIGIIAFPMHTNEEFRAEYEASKLREQVDFSSSGGRRSRTVDKTEPAIQAVVNYCRQNRVTVGSGGDYTNASSLRHILFYRLEKGERGDTWTGGEQDLILAEAFARLKEMREEEKPPPPSDTTREYVWESDFTWREELALIMQDHPQYRDYHAVFLASEIMGLNPYKNAKQFEELTHFKKSANWKWLNRMKNDEGFQGWLKETRARLHERYVAQRLRAAGWDVQEQPEFDWEGLHYQEDLYATKDDKTVWINCKCGSGNRTYVADEYKTTYILANQAHAEAYILYLDLEENVHDIFLPGDRFSVGSRGSGLGAMEPTDGKDASTPILLLRALAAPGEGAPETGAEANAEARAEAGAMSDLAPTMERLLDATMELARTGGLEAAERTLGHKLGTEAVAAIMSEVRSRLDAKSPAARANKKKGPTHARGPRERGGRKRGELGVAALKREKKKGAGKHPTPR